MLRDCLPGKLVRSSEEHFKERSVGRLRGDTPTQFMQYTVVYLPPGWPDRRMHMDETSAVLSTNSAFYAAFTAKVTYTNKCLVTCDRMCEASRRHPRQRPLLCLRDVLGRWAFSLSSSKERGHATVASTSADDIHNVFIYIYK